MDPCTYHLEMERRFNAVMIPTIAVFSGIAAVTILSVRFGVDPRSVFVLALLCVIAISGVAMCWWNFTVLPRERKMKGEV